jgi:serine O-acetyltransferase
MAPTERAFRTDLDKYYTIVFGTTTPSLMGRLKLWLSEFGLHCVAVYRFGKAVDRLRQRSRLLGLIPKLIHWVANLLMQFLHHVDLEEADIGPGFYIGHVGTIYIGPTTIGANFSITHNVTIGEGHSKGAEGIPVIGDNVWVGTGSVISGAITIGSGVTVTSGSVLSRSVPEGSLVGGNPGRVIMREYDNSKLIGFSVD